MTKITSNDKSGLSTIYACFWVFWATREYPPRTYGRVHQGQNPRWVAHGRVRKLKTQPKPAFGEVYLCPSYQNQNTGCLLNIRSLNMPYPVILVTFSTDCLVASGETAGLVVACCLSEDPKTNVVALESGPDASHDRRI